MIRLPISRAFRKRRFHPLKWKRRWKVIVLDLLGREESPERVAAAIALGIGIGFSPFLGFHIWLALGFAWILVLAVRLLGHGGLPSGRAPQTDSRTSSLTSKLA